MSANRNIKNVSAAEPKDDNASADTREVITLIMMNVKTPERGIKR